MSTRLMITVTKEILEESKHCGFDADNCAITRAVRLIFPLALTATTYMIPYGRNGFKGVVCESTMPNDNLIHLPKEITEWINNFDRSYPDERVAMPEISFEIEIPDEVLETINIDYLRPLLANHRTLKLIEV